MHTFVPIKYWKDLSFSWENLSGVWSRKLKRWCRMNGYFLINNNLPAALSSNLIRHYDVGHYGNAWPLQRILAQLSGQTTPSLIYLFPIHQTRLPHPIFWFDRRLSRHGGVGTMIRVLIRRPPRSPLVLILPTYLPTYRGWVDFSTRYQR